MRLEFYFILTFTDTYYSILLTWGGPSTLYILRGSLPPDPQGNGNVGHGRMFRALIRTHIHPGPGQ